jgi:DNA polymerase, archaea type
MAELQSFTHSSHSQTINKEITLPLTFVCFDFEWQLLPDAKGNQPFRAASFVDSFGLKKVFLIQDYEKTFGRKAEYALLLEIINFLARYEYSFGWYSKGFESYNDQKKRIEGKNSDLVMLDKRLKANGIPSIVGFNMFGTPYIIRASHIDAMKLYEKPMVKVSIYKNKYTGMALDMVSKAIIGREKYKGYSGKDFDNQPTLEDKRNYVLEDSQLVFDILQYNNYEIIKLMSSIANLTGISFETVCNGGVSKLWTRILDDIIPKELERLASIAQINSPRYLLLKEYHDRQTYQKSVFQEENEVYLLLDDNANEEEENEDDNYSCSSSSEKQQRKKEKDIKFEGGKVIEPIRGEHRNVIVFDVASLYPKMVINYNISFDTILCNCCKDNPLARVPKEITDVKDYWICKKQQGIFTERMLHFTKERLKQKQLGNEIDSQGLKILINAGYGVFGYEYFKYFNHDVSILIAAYGRYTLTRMTELAEMQGLKVIYGDTDSLFIIKGNVKIKDYSHITDEEIEQFKSKCAQILNIDVKHERTFGKAIIAKKKHYLGISKDKTKQPVIKGFEGIKSDRVEWVRNAFAQVIEDYKNSINPLSKLKQTFLDLEQWNLKEPEKVLLKTTKIGKDPEDYENNCLSKRIGLELGLRRGDVASYYLADNEKGYTFDINECSISQYKKMLSSTVKDIVEILGYDVECELFGGMTYLNSLL